MLANTNLVSCNFSSLPLKSSKSKASLQIRNFNPEKPRLSLLKAASKSSSFLKLPCLRTAFVQFHKKGHLQTCHSNLNSQDSEEDTVLDEGSLATQREGSGNKEERNWTSSLLLFLLWGALMYYVFNLTPDQTPSRDTYFLKKLLNLAGNDGFKMNEVLVSLWYIMGLWPLVYSMLLLPTGRSSKSNIPVWPFLVLSCFGGAYALLPYFVLWKPPPPPVEETELTKWPLNFMESKVTAVISFAAGLCIVIYAGLSNGGEWEEFCQYFRESKFIHIMSIDFMLLSAFAPFWVYNDMTARRWYDKGWWLIPASLVPFLGPALYLVLRPYMSEVSASISPISSGQK
ncbi:uncharacterized protein LOC110808672 isoform X1 [Carica papaya]|uniref:uncharacterized protein LOC110808672 isoform X1 n=1 Tax=Carica papaya TaxID=3649 RepID=UPI000B8CE88D|nr:uncharacterized protein LOC110808672 isoform X1 [Carica papaya]